ncbi:MAG: serine/threonine-protein phosphatase [Clostridia bacterium]|nr:serine/threonine-protein phosphatase [Clostridia bacterium]
MRSGIQTKQTGAERTGRAFRILARGSSDPGARSAQQDAFLISDRKLSRERGMMAVLSDGMGGMRDGELYSRIATQEMIRYFETADPRQNICDILLNAYRAARRTALQQTGAHSGGATVVAAAVRSRRCAILSVGDSRICLFRGGGLIPLNREHTLGRQLDERAALGYIPEEEARYNIYRDTLTNHLCAESELPADRCLKPFKVCPGDKLLMMSDGVSGTLSDEEIVRFLSMPRVSGADAMIEEIRRRGLPNQDNSTALILAFESYIKTEIGG